MTPTLAHASINLKRNLNWKGWVVCGVLGVVFSACNRTQQTEGQARAGCHIQVLAYDTLTGKKGWLEKGVMPEWQRRQALLPEAEHCKVTLVPAADSGQMVMRLRQDSERGSPTAHWVMGLEESGFEQSASWLESQLPSEIEKAIQGVPWTSVARDSRTEVSSAFIPFDTSVLALIVNTDLLRTRKLESPKKLSDLAAPAWDKQWLLQDPRSSAPGRSFLQFTRVLWGESAALDFWKKTRWFAMPAGWDQAYGLFMKNQAPAVWSYLTSQAYHRIKGQPEEKKFQAVVFQEGNPAVVEGMALVKRPRTPAEVKALALWAEVVLSEAAMKVLPTTQWMFPAREGADLLPPEFKELPRPSKIWRLSHWTSIDMQWQERWLDFIHGVTR